MSNASTYTNRDPRYYGLAEWFYPERALLTYAQVFLNPLVYALEGAVGGAQRRWRRERRRRLVGRSYDMALELARVLPPRARVLDVGCGSGFIAHHLSSLLGTRVSGIDVRKSVDAPIDYTAFDAVLLCYVLHHAQDQPAFLDEVRRVLRDAGLVVVYEDIPEAAWDAAACRAHDRAWRARTGPCTFRLWEEWRRVFTSSGFEVLSVRRLSRWRNFTHPVRRGLYVLRVSDSRRPAV